MLAFSPDHDIVIASRYMAGGGTDEVELDPSQLELFDGSGPRAGDGTQVQVRTSDGAVYWGSWVSVVRQMRENAGFGHEGLVSFMRRMAERWHEVTGVEILFQDPEAFLRSAAEARLIFLEVDPAP